MPGLPDGPALIAAAITTKPVGEMTAVRAGRIPCVAAMFEGTDHPMAVEAGCNGRGARVALEKEAEGRVPSWGDEFD